MYTAGTVFLEVATSFLGSQRDIGNEARRRMGVATKAAQDVLDESERRSEASGKRTGQKYGSAYERAVKERLPRMREAIKNLGKELDGDNSVKTWAAKAREELKSVASMDMRSTAGQSAVEDKLRGITKELDSVLRSGKIVNEQLSDLDRVNLGGLRTQMQALNREMERWNRAGPSAADELAQKEGIRVVRAEQEMERAVRRRGGEQLRAEREYEQAVRRRASEQERAAQMMRADDERAEAALRRRASEQGRAAQMMQADAERAEASLRRRVNLETEAARLRDRDFTSRGDEIMDERRERVRRSLRDVADRAQDDGRMRLGVDIDTGAAIARVTATRAAMQAVLDQAIELGVEADVDGAVRSAQRAVTAAETSVEGQVIRINTEVQRAQAVAQVTALRSQIAALADDITFNVDIDQGAAQAQIQLLRQQLRSLSGSVNVNGDILRLERLERQLGRVGRQAGQTGAAMAALDASGAANAVRVFNGALFATVSIGPLLIPVLGVIATGIVGVGVAALGALVGVGALVAGLSGIGGAVKAMSEMQKAGRTAPGGSKKVQSGRDEIQAARALVDAQKAIEKARVSGAKSIERAEENVASATVAAAKTRADAAAAIEQAVERVADAEARLQDAQKASLAAQVAINDARAQAARDLEDINNQLASARLAEQEGNFSVQEAAVGYNMVLEDDQATDREKAKAKLAYDQAVQRQKEQRLALSRLEADTKKANEAGIEGSDRVVKAKDEITKSVERVREAEKGLSDAVSNVDEVRVEQNERIIASEMEVVDAVEKAAETRADAAESIADAQESLRRTIEDQRLAAAEAAIATGTLATATNNLDEAMRNLSPAGQEFARFLYSLAPLLKDIRWAAQEGMLPGFQEALSSIVDVYGPGFVDFIGSMSEVLGDLAIQAADALTGPWWRQFFDYMAEVTPVFMQQWGELGGNIVLFFAGIAQAFAPLSLDIMDTLVRGSEIIAEWATGLKDSDAFQGFLDYMRDAAPEVGRLFSNLFTILGKLLVGLAPYSDALLELTIGFTDWLASMDPKTLANIAFVLGGMVLVVQTLAGLMAPILGAIGIFNALSGIWVALKIAGATLIRTVLAPMLSTLAGISAPVWIVVGAIAALVAGFVILWNTNEGFRDMVKDAWASIVDAWDASLGWISDTALPALGAAWDWLYEHHISPFLDMAEEGLGMLGAAFQLLWDIVYLGVLKPLGEAVGFLWENWMKPIFGLIWQIISEVIAPVFLWLWTDIISPTFGFISAIFETTWAVMKTVFDAISQIITYVIGPAFKWLYDEVISPVFGWIGDKITVVWNDTIKPIFDLLSSYISDTVGPAFATAVGVLGAIWGGILDLMRAPIRLAIEYVVNKGLIGAFNWIADKVPGMTKLDEVAIPDALLPGGVNTAKLNQGQIAGGPGKATGLATGGIIPGYSPGHDNHRFVSDSGMVLDLAGGEPVLRPEVGSVLGKGWVDGVNQAARIGGTGGVRSFLGGYAGGGILPKMAGGSLEDFFAAIGDVWNDAGNAVSGFVSSAADFIANPADSLSKVVQKAGSDIGLSGPLGQAGIGIALKPIDAISDWIKGLFGDDASDNPARSRGGSFNDAGANAMGYQAQIAVLKNQFPGARITSSFRPGAITSVGTKSYHGMGRAIDIAPDMRIASWLFDTFPNSRELIHTPAGARQIRNGKPFSAFAPITKAQHNNHIHWAMANGGIVPNLYDNGGDLPTGISVVANKTGKPERVITEKMMTEIRETSRQRAAAAMEVNIDGQFGYDPAEVADEIDKVRRNALAVAGLDTMGVL